MNYFEVYSGIQNSGPSLAKKRSNLWYRGCKKKQFIFGRLVQTLFLFSFVFDMSIFAFSHLKSAQTTENVDLPTATKALGYFGLLKGARFCGSHSKNVINSYYTYLTPSYII